MQQSYPYKALVLFIGIVVVSLLLLIRAPDRSIRDSEKIVYVVCTTSMLADLVSQIGGEQVQVDCLMGPGIDPHTYRARESDMHKLAQADLILYHGLHLEGKMITLFERMQSRTKNSVAIAHAIPVDKVRRVSESDQMVDPHIWHDVALWRLVQNYVRDILIAQDSAHKQYYEDRTARYDKQLAELDEYIRTKIAPVTPSRRILITAHDAFGYFGKAYGFQVVGLQGISTDSDVGLHDINRIVDILITHDIRALFVESLVSPRTIRAVQSATEARGKKVLLGEELFADALGGQSTDAHTYIDMMKHNIHAIVHALA